MFHSIPTSVLCPARGMAHWVEILQSVSLGITLYISFWNHSHLIFYSAHHICQNITEPPPLTIFNFQENPYSNYVCNHKSTHSFADDELVKNFQLILGKYSKKQPHYVTCLISAWMPSVVFLSLISHKPRQYLKTHHEQCLPCTF